MIDATNAMPVHWTGVGGWPLTPATGGKFPGERTPTCPQCQSQSVSWGVQSWGGSGTGPCGRARMGDGPALYFIRCEACRHYHYWKA